MASMAESNAKMQNGSIGEARTQAFLIDRFWVLERSVDIDGADFIIHRRITSANLLDKRPPRFGVVYAKFFAGPKTSHHIYKQYLCLLPKYLPKWIRKTKYGPATSTPACDMFQIIR